MCSTVMAQGPNKSDDDMLVKQLEGMHISMDETDDYVPDITPTVTQGQQSASNVAQSAPGHTQMMGSQQVAQLHNPSMTVVPQPPTTSDVAVPQPVAAFFGGYSTTAGDPVAQPYSATFQTAQPAAPAGTSNAPALQSEATIASKVSFRSLHPGKDPKLPAYAFCSDPRGMSTIVDAQYAPLPRAENEFLTVLPHITNMTRPMPLNMTPEEVFLLYDTLMHHCQQNIPVDPEECDLYGGSVNALPADWLQHLPPQAQGSSVPPPPIPLAQVPPLPQQPQAGGPVPQQMAGGQVPQQVLAQVQQQIAGQVAQLIAGQVAQPIAGHVPQAIAGQVPQQIAGQVQQTIQGQLQSGVQQTPPSVPTGNQQALANVPMNIQQPANPVLQAALYQAMAQHGQSASVTMDDVANLMITSDTTLDTKSINPKDIVKDPEGSDSTLDSASSTTSSERRRRRRCTIL